MRERPTKLPDFEETIIEIVVELLLLAQEQRYPDLIFGAVEDIDAVRITRHYVMALLSYGFSPREEELSRAAAWFDRPFPEHDNDTVDRIEMNRLLMLLDLLPESDGVQKRLQQLTRQLQSELYFDLQPGWPEFDTLWALHAFTRAKQAQILSEEIITTAEIERRLDWLIAEGHLKRDKDDALALRLHYEMFGYLKEFHEQKLTQLIEVAEKNQGVWGIREIKWRVEDKSWFKDLIQGRKVLHEHVGDDLLFFRKVILSTCMVVEYLSPLVDDYPNLRAPLERAIQLWWEQFNGQNAVTTLRLLFPKPNDYDYLLVLCRTLRSVREYIREPLRGLDTVHLLRELTNIKSNTSEPSEIRSIKDALRNWIQIDLAGPVERLKLGFSEANVVRVQPYVWSPLASGEDRPTSLIQHSLIIKYGTKEMIEAERENYKALPAATRDCFVRIPEESHVDPDSGLCLVVMQDLRDYKTLYEAHEEVAAHVNDVADQLGTFLQRMHRGGSSQLRPVSRSLMRELYLSRMIEYVDRVFQFVLDPHLGESAMEVRNLQYALFDRISDIIHHQQRLEAFTAAHTHGDLHLRNIMVKGLDPKFFRQNEVTFKLIDLEFMRRDGDMAFDAGQLLVDIELVSREEQRIKSRSRLIKLRDKLENTYHEFGRERQDPTFGVRLELAKARALLRIAKGKAKRGAKYMEKNQLPQAEQIRDDLVEHSREAQQHLQAVVSAIRGK